MVAMMVWRPRGLISEREPSVIFKERKAISGSLVKEGTRLMSLVQSGMHQAASIPVADLQTAKGHG
jgi:hypothetical protein